MRSSCQLCIIAIHGHLTENNQGSSFVLISYDESINKLLHQEQMDLGKSLMQ